MEKYIQSACSVCMHRDRDEIDKLLLAGVMKQRAIAKQFNLNENSISVHKRKHLISNIKDKLKDIVQQSLLENIKPENVSDLVKLLDYVTKMSDDDFLLGKKEYDTEKQKMFERFEKALKLKLSDGTLFFAPYCEKCGHINSQFPEGFVDDVLALVKLTFVDNKIIDNKIDLEEFVKAVLEPKEYLKDNQSGA